MFKIILSKNDMRIELPKDIGLGLFEACYRADLYKQRNEKAVFTVVNMDTGNIEYQV